MPKFSAEAIEPIEYDFRGFRDDTGESINDHGVVPEPSRARVSQMMDNIQNAFKDLGVSSKVETPEDIAAALDEADKLKKDDEDNDLFEKMNDKLFEAMADLCNGKPSRESLERLPYRGFMGFFGYLMGEVMNPDTLKADTKSSRADRRKG